MVWVNHCFALDIAEVIERRLVDNSIIGQGVELVGVIIVLNRLDLRNVVHR